MPETRNKQQAAADAVVRAFKARRRVVGIAERGLKAPQDLSVEDIENICRFVVIHAECIKTGEDG